MLKQILRRETLVPVFLSVVLFLTGFYGLKNEAIRGAIGIKAIPENGVDYYKLDGVPRTENKLEFFFTYRCAECYPIIPRLKEWGKTSEKTEVKYIHAASNPAILRDAGIHYALERILATDKTKDIVSASFQFGKIKNSKDIYNIVKNSEGINQAILFGDMIKDRRVHSDIKEAMLYGSTHHVTGPMTIVINGVYLMKPSQLNDYGKALETINFLLSFNP